MKLTIDITDEMYQAVKNGTWCGNELWYNALKNGIPHETVTEFADRCRECGARYGRLLNQKWIPVSEDLPKDAYGCIVTVLDVDLRTQNEFENILPYFVGYDGETWNNADGEPIPYEVIAWTKAPEPYKAEGSGEE